MIDVQQVSRYFGDVTAVNDVSFKVEKGEIVGFLGPNAAGKTTTMRILTTYLPATSGTATVAGYDVHEQSMEVRKRIGYLPENPPLYQDMRVKDYLEFVAKIKGVAPAERKKAVDDAMAKTAIGDVSTRVIKVLSKGYKQRVGLAQALVHNPDVLILDEPTVGLDPNQIIEVRQLIKRLAGDHTIILSTHILPEVSMTCERVVIINKGVIVATDTTDGLTKKHAGATRLTVSVDAPVAAVKEKLATIKGVTKVEETSGSEYTTVFVESDKDVEIRPEVAKIVVANNWPLYEIKAEDVSLEDVFLHLTTKEEGTVS
ncbi:ATP-binding cassette domain-containing protein [candidate division KSB1 bacterium]|nr:ATP-binding cassette domain-containing protein [candidate division KSB1 bacterium]RQW05498.1 MAG: ATP-binding cassette domain-containing protein [candidate division KSB1 bacterium]